MKHRVQHLAAASILSCGVMAIYGCTYDIDAIAKHSLASQSKKFTFYVNNSERFSTCLDTPRGQCPAHDVADADGGFFSPQSPRTSPVLLDSAVSRPDYPNLDRADMDAELGGKIQATQVVADMARAVLEHEVQIQLDALFNTALGLQPAANGLSDNANGAASPLYVSEGAPPSPLHTKLNITLESFEDYQSSIEAATLLGGWDALAAESDLLEVSDRNLGHERRKAYIKTYFEAYFRRGQFFKASIDASKLKARIVEELEERVPGLEPGDYEALAGELFPQYKLDKSGTTYVFGRLDDSGFVTRDGQMVAFPTIEATVTLGESQVQIGDIDYTAVGSDLIKVLLHALFDSHMQLPASIGATGLLVPDYPLIQNDPDQTGVSGEEFATISQRATQAEGVVSAGTGRVIRGISLASLNNEALATAIETAVGVAVRKPIEKVLWCWYACRFNENHGDESDYLVTAFGTEVTVEVNVSGFEAEITGTAERH